MICQLFFSSFSFVENVCVGFCRNNFCLQFELFIIIITVAIIVVVVIIQVSSSS